MATTEVLILSDSHGKSEAVQQTIRLTRPHVILFCGDGLRDLAYLDPPCPLYAVRGNCDVFSIPTFDHIRDEELLSLDGFRMLITHGHRYGVKGGLGLLLEKAARENADAVIFGHTHEPMDITLFPENTSAPYGISLNKPLHVFNPGSLGYAPHSFGTLTLKNGSPLFGHGELRH